MHVPPELLRKSLPRSLVSITLSWTVIAVAISGAASSPWWLFPVFAFVIANRQLALSLLAHEGLHSSLSESRPVNDFLGRFLCAFPVYVCFDTYRKKHLLHHRLLGSPADPDRGLYFSYPENAWRFFSRMTLSLLTGRLLWLFFDYYTPLPQLLRSRKLNIFWKELRTEFGVYLLFHGLLISALVQFGWGRFYLLYWVAPLLLSLPYIWLIGGLQHGPLPDADPARKARTITGAKWLMEILLPVDIHFHAEHHLAPQVPHQHLRSLHQHLRGQDLWRETYPEALGALLNPQVKTPRNR